MSGAKYKKDELKGRIIKAGDTWGVVKSNSAENIEVWNDLSGHTTLTVLPSFKLAKGSPCINAGRKVQGETEDLFGGKRSGNPDIGALEFSGK